MTCSTHSSSWSPVTLHDNIASINIRSLFSFIANMLEINILFMYNVRNPSTGKPILVSQRKNNTTDMRLLMTYRVHSSGIKISQSRAYTWICAPLKANLKWEKRPKEKERNARERESERGNPTNPSVTYTFAILQAKLNTLKIYSDSLL